MNILIDHGAYANLGDLAMLEAIVRLYLESDSGAHLFVRSCPLPDEVRREARVHEIAFSMADPAAQTPVISRWPALAARVPMFGRVWAAYLFARLGRGIDPGRLRVYSKKGPRTLREWVAEFDAFHAAGGGDLTDLFPHEVWRRCCFLHAFAATNKPAVLTGQQIGPLGSPILRKSLGRALRKARFVGVREPLDSLAFCRGAGLAAGQFGLMGDDSFGLATERGERVEAILRELNLRDGEFLAVNIRTGPYARENAQYFADAGRSVSALARRRGMPVLIAPISLDEGDSDVESGRRLACHITGARVEMLPAAGLTAGAAKGVLGRAFAGLGVSYHFCTFGLEQGLPMVALYAGRYYEQKARGLAAFWGEPRLALPLARVSSAESLETINRVFDDAGLRGRLADRGEEAVRAWRRQAREQTGRILNAQERAGRMGAGV